jgi:dTDP-4-dehydrorhamnose reductase
MHLQDEATPPETGSAAPALELWGGVECTVNRVGDIYLDQLQCNGHRVRLDDLDRFAELGIRALRYPVLWETTAPEGVERADWAWPDQRLNRLRELGLRPIAGLVHHGSGPPHTSLVDPAFAEGLAVFARAVAERYPWLEDYTPVNEPLTTARFSGMYGHWYPHGTDALTFARALLNQCRAVVLAMRAIRTVNPRARLVQTEDMGKTWSTPRLAYQADFENERRWLSFDLLCGRVDRHHWMWQYLRWVGVAEDELRWFLDNPCPPDVLGINHYLTSERFLDERRERYPAHTHGENGRDTYADVEAVRVVAQGLAGPGALLRETWDRYGLPVAVTEAHLGCTREEQMRWLLEVWKAAGAERARGADIRAVTAWSLIGAYDWDSLLTRPRGHYEPGVFDLRSPEPRPTALAGLIRDIAAGREPGHPALAGPGWWRRDARLLYPPVPAHPAAEHAAAVEAARDAEHGHETLPRRPLLITGAGGTLAEAFARMCVMRGLAFRALGRHELDIADPAAVARALDEVQPWAVINAAGYPSVDGAEVEPYRCFRENTKGPAVLAAECARRRGVGLVTFSSDLVFDGAKGAPYVESDAVAPLSVYGRSQAEAEARVLDALPSALVVRAGAFFGPWDDENVVTRALRALAAGLPSFQENVSTITPVYVPDLAQASLDLLIDGESGLWHLANGGEVTRADLVRRAAEQAGLDPSGVEVWPVSAGGRRGARRPLYSALGSERGTLLLPSLDDALARYARFGQAQWTQQNPLAGWHERPRPRRVRTAAAAASPALASPGSRGGKRKGA